MAHSIPLRRARLAAAWPVVAQAATRAPGAALDITGARSWTVREPVSRRTYTVVRIDTRAGLSGYGECAALSAAEFEGAVRAITGVPATSFEAVAPLLAAYPTARAALNTAMLDVAGKAAKAPVFQLLGGPTRAKARALAQLTGDSDAALIASMKRAHAAGFRAFSVPVPATLYRNQGQAYVLATQRRLNALREAAGDDCDFVLDGENRLTPGDAQMVSAAIERFHVMWFNEPCPTVNLSALARIAGENVTPVGLGRHVRDAAEIQDLLRHDAVDIIRPDLGINGISQVRRMAAIAEVYYVAAGPVHNGGPIGTAAALHLAASIPNFFIQQIPLPEADEDRRMRAELTGRSIETVNDGFAELPVGAGLGITVNEQALEKYKEAAA
ncbi:MAG: mandelate racemase/muconate lactonizing enzyme family protein [bacterium]|jgi:galactonate dehydratase